MPASGLHAVMPEAPVSSAYMVGLMNSTPVQEVAAALPPGLLRQEDLTALGLPFIAGADGEEIEALAIQQADEVVDLMRTHAGRWPKLRDALREDVSLGEVVEDAWLPEAGPLTTWGTIRTVPWVEIEATGNVGTRRIARVLVENTLFGLAVELRDDRDRAIRLRVVGGDEARVQALAVLAEGLRASEAGMGSVLDASVPTDPDLLVQQLSSHRRQLAEAIGRYRERRARIDEIVEALL